jgi:hypothetical protein
MKEFPSDKSSAPKSRVPSTRRKTPPRVAPRMEGKVKNVGTKPVKKDKKSK